MKNKSISLEIQLQKTIAEYQQRLKEQEKEYNSKLKSIAKDMSVQIEENEQKYNQQLHDYIRRLKEKTESFSLFFFIIRKKS